MHFHAYLFDIQLFVSALHKDEAYHALAKAFSDLPSLDAIMVMVDIAI